MSFERFGADLLDGLAAPTTDDPLMVEEVKLGCTLAMLTCLDRDHRLVHVLAEELGRIERGRPRLARLHAREATREMEALHATARLMRSHPEYSAPADIIDEVRAAIRGSHVIETLTGRVI